MYLLTETRSSCAICLAEAGQNPSTEIKHRVLLKRGKTYRHLSPALPQTCQSLPSLSSCPLQFLTQKQIYHLKDKPLRKGFNEKPTKGFFEDPIHKKRKRTLAEVTELKLLGSSVRLHTQIRNGLQVLLGLCQRYLPEKTLTLNESRLMMVLPGASLSITLNSGCCQVQRTRRARAERPGLWSSLRFSRTFHLLFFQDDPLPQRGAQRTF